LAKAKEVVEQKVETQEAEKETFIVSLVTGRPARTAL
jgi:hypothetical protein